MKNSLLLLVLVAAWVSVSALSPSPAPAQDIYQDIYLGVYEGSETKGPEYRRSGAEKRARKFFRGLSNTFLFLGEIPVAAFREAHETSPVTGSFVGIGQGSVEAAKRLGWGLWEVVTFWKPNEHVRGDVGFEYFFRDYWTSDNDADVVVNWEPYIYPEVVFLDAIE